MVDFTTTTFSAHNDFADIEGETEDLVQLREEMVEFAHDRGEGHAVKDLDVAVTMQVIQYDFTNASNPFYGIFSFKYPQESRIQMIAVFLALVF